MEPLLEVNPLACVFVVGPQMASDVTANAAAGLGYRVHGGRAPTVQAAAMAAALREAERPFAAAGRDQPEPPRLPERDLAAARGHAVDVLSLAGRRGAYEPWQRRTFGGLGSGGDDTAAVSSSERRFCATAPPQPHGPQAERSNPEARVSCTPSLRLLLQLQRRGTLLVYAHCDTALDDAAGTAPVLASDGARFQEWASGETPGFLHVNGVYTKPNSVLLDAKDYEQSLSKPTLASLRKIFRQRLAIFVGFDEKERADAFLLQKMLRAFYSDEAAGSVRNPPILFATTASTGSHTSKASQATQLGSGDGFLRLSVSREEMLSLDTLIAAGLEKNFAIGMQCNLTLM